MSPFSADLMHAIRARFAHVESCPFTGPRIFFENAGGALTLNTVVETAARFAAIPDNQGRENGASKALVDIIARAKADLMAFMQAPNGQVFAGESGTELLFRLIRTACAAAPSGAAVIGSSIEHPASRSAARHWAEQHGLEYLNVRHDDATGLVTPEAYGAQMRPDVAVATILHASPVTGMAMDVGAIAAAIRKVAPACTIVVDGIQHAAHGRIDLSAYDVDGYVISPYKVFARHGFGMAWISERFAAVPHERLLGAPADGWELGTRDSGAYATLSDVVAYFDWLGGRVGGGPERNARIKAAGQAIHAHETHLVRAMIEGTGQLPGLRDMAHVQILGGADNPARAGLVSITVDDLPATDVVAWLNTQGIRTHIRKADHYSANVLEPLGLDGCVRISICHYNTLEEVSQLLMALAKLAEPTP